MSELDKASFPAAKAAFVRSTSEELSDTSLVAARVKGSAGPEELNGTSSPAIGAASVTSDEESDTSPPAAEGTHVKGQPNSQSTPAENRRLFGLKAKGVYTGQQDFSDDYEKRFPEDPMFEETGPNARVWRTYLVESTTFDENMVGEARDGLDAMLVFAGLFSAVVTSFLVQTSQNLQPDYTEMSASLLSELIAVQRAAANGTSVNTVPAAALTLNTNFIPDTLDVWVNGLWVISLTLGLIVALSAVLIKQWLHRYIDLRSGTPKDRSLIRHLRFIGFKKWQVLGIIGSLPAIMHLSLGIFLLGLVLFLIPLQLVLACIVGTMTFMVYTLYLASNILPILHAQCPYQSPLTDFIVIVLRWIYTSYKLNFKIGKLSRRARAIQVAPSDENGILSVQALHWLFEVSTNPSVHSVVLQATAGLPATAALELRKLFGYGDARSVFHRLSEGCIRRADQSSNECVEPHREAVAERLMRTSLARGDWSYGHLVEAAIRTWEKSDPSRDQRYLATALSCTHPFVCAPSDLQISPLLRQYILSHHGVRHQPSVWQALLKMSMMWDVFSDSTTDTIMFGTLFRALFGKTDSKDRSNDINTQPMGPAVQLDQGLHQRLCSHLLSKMSAQDNAAQNRLSVPAGHASASERLWMATLEHELRHLSVEPSNFDSVHWQIISEVFDDERHGMMTEQHLQMFFKTFVALLIQQTDICCSPPRGPEAFIKLQQNVLKAYLRFTWGGRGHGSATLTYLVSGHLTWDESMVSASTQEIEPTFLRAIKNPLSNIGPSINGHIMREHVNVLFSILASGILDGVTSAYALFVDYDCLELALKCSDHSVHLSPQHGPAVELARAFAIGLISKTTVDAAEKERCVDYLFKPRNLRLVAISYIQILSFLGLLSVSRVQNLRSRVHELFKLRPDQGAWDQCRRWLNHVLKWVKDGKKEDLQDNQELEDKWIVGILWTPLWDFGHQPVIEQFICSLDEFLASSEIINEQALDHPHSTKPVSESSPAVPAPEVDAGETKRWTSPILHKLLRWRAKDQGHSSKEDV